MTSFPELITARRRGDHATTFEVTENWLQGRTSFGGLIAAYAVQAMRDVVDAAWPADVSLRALQTSFIAPIGRGQVEVTVRLLREGKTVRQVQAEVRQDGQTCSVMLGVFAVQRASTLAVLRPTRPAPAKPVDELPSVPFMQGIAPNFLQNFEIRWSDGPPPFSGGTGWSVSLHMRPRVHDATIVSNEVLTVLLADLTPPPAIGHFTRPTPMSSISWALELRPVKDALGDGWWRADTDALVVDGGYVNQAGRLWAPDGSLAALAYQVVTVSA